MDALGFEADCVIESPFAIGRGARVPAEPCLSASIVAELLNAGGIPGAGDRSALTMHAVPKTGLWAAAPDGAQAHSVFR